MRIERQISAGADELYEAFVDVAWLRRWFQPAPGLAASSASADTDGAALSFATPIGEVALQFTWRERDPARSLAFDLRRTDPRGSHDSQVQVTFEPRGDRTQLTLQHDGLVGDQVAESHAAWRHSLGRIVGVCTKALDAFYANLGRAAGYRSPFGGLWPDRLDADQRLQGKLARGELTAEDGERFRRWMEDGYVSLPGAVSHDVVDAFRDEVARDWERGNSAVTIELCEGDGGYHKMHPSMRQRPSKVLDYHGVSAHARDIEFAPAIHRFLTQLFERPPMAHQSLLFTYGTEQAMHQDTAYVVLRSPMEFVGCWVALEDVVEGSGELQYYVGSHRIPEFLWFERSRGRPPGYDDDAEFLAWVERHSQQAGCERRHFLPKKGDALVWHADLVHGGSPRVHRDLTRRSFVTHYCPVDVDPAWMREGHQRHEHAPGAWYCHLQG